MDILLVYFVVTDREKTLQIDMIINKQFFFNRVVSYYKFLTYIDNSL